MNKKKILVTGGEGRFAKVLKEKNKLLNVYFATKKNCNILNLRSIENIVRKVKPKIIIHCAGLSRPMSIHNNEIKKSINQIVIVGGGTAGWMTAASISALIGKGLSVTLIESDQIGTVGVGEATIPTFFALHQLLKIDESEFLSAVQGTIKLGISFENWHTLGKSYIHAFGHTGKSCWAAGFHHFWLKGKENGFSEDYGCYSPELTAAKSEKFGFLKQNPLNYAYHLNAGLYAKFLRKIAEQNGVIRKEGKIVQVSKTDDGNISNVALESGEITRGDLFVDCSGFAGLLIDKALETPYTDWSNWLPCDRAVALQTRSTGAPVPYTRSIAHHSGWQWKIPLQSRVGNGLVYSSKYMEDKEALAVLKANVDGEIISKPNFIKFKTGQRVKHWSKNLNDIEGTQKVFNHRAKMNTLAAQGKWSKELEN